MCAGGCGQRRAGAMRWCSAGRVLNVAAALLLAGGLPRPARAPRPPRPCRSDALCLCRDDHLACSQVPFHRFPQTGTQPLPHLIIITFVLSSLSYHVTYKAMVKLVII